MSGSNLFQKLDENILFRGRKSSDRCFMSLSGRIRHRIVNFSSLHRQAALLRSTIGRGRGSADEAPRLKSAERSRGRRSIQSYRGRQRRLIGLATLHER